METSGSGGSGEDGIVINFEISGFGHLFFGRLI